MQTPFSLHLKSSFWQTEFGKRIRIVSFIGRQSKCTDGSAVDLVGIVSAVVGSVADPPERNAREAVLAAELPVAALLIGRTIPLVGSIGTVATAVAAPPLRHAAIRLGFAFEFRVGALAARELVVALAAVLAAVADPPLRDAGVVAAATVLAREAFTFRRCDGRKIKTSFSGSLITAR